MARKVLIIEDQATLLTSLARMLKLHYSSMDVFLAKNEQEAREHLVENTIDLVISDLCLNQENGLEIASQFCREYPRTKILIMTAYGNQEIAWQTFSSACVGYLEKPFEIDELISLVDACLAPEHAQASKAIRTIHDFSEEFLRAEIRSSVHDWITATPKFDS